MSIQNTDPSNIAAGDKVSDTINPANLSVSGQIVTSVSSAVSNGVRTFTIVTANFTIAVVEFFITLNQQVNGKTSHWVIGK